LTKKNYVIDTSVFLSDAHCIYSFGNNDIFIPLKVLEEIDKHKKRQDSVGFNARKIIKTLDTYREKKSLKDGFRIAKGKGILRVMTSDNIDRDVLPKDLISDVADNMIVATALTIQKENTKRKTVLVSRDINLRVIANSVGIVSEDYITEQVIDSSEKLYSGFASVLVDDEMVDQFYAEKPVILDEDLLKQQKIKLQPNQYVMLVSSSNEKKTALCRFSTHYQAVEVLFKPTPQWGIESRNKEQSFALDLLYDEATPLVTLIGGAGTGKTLLAILAGIEQTIMHGSEGTYRRIIISRPVQPMGKDIGFLPGTMEEKMGHWLKPIQDNLQTIMGNDKQLIKGYFDKGIIEVEALTYIRGRSIPNSYIVIDEAQNLTAHEVKTILTRVGEGTKIVLTGDIEQIDNAYTNETSNGLAYAVEKLKGSKLSGHVTLQKGERSKLASLAAKLL
jgi:PhoH-like ATPase|tara:strand:- start:178 stop:1518 length:1341 start_codon:yes stop_codon:yes gene_type:complete